MLIFLQLTPNVLQADALKLDEVVLVSVLKWGNLKFYPFLNTHSMILSGRVGR